jgi:hypothetical protein
MLNLKTLTAKYFSSGVGGGDLILVVLGKTKKGK